MPFCIWIFKRYTWSSIGNRAIDHGDKGRLVVMNDKIVLKVNGKLANVQLMIWINGKKYSFIIDDIQKKATMAKFLNRKKYDEIKEELAENKSTLIEFKGKFGAKKKLLIGRKGLFKSFMRAAISGS